jgi:hypothetical protein
VRAAMVMNFPLHVCGKLVGHSFHFAMPSTDDDHDVHITFSLFWKENLVKEGCLYLQLKQTKVPNGSTPQPLYTTCKQFKNNLIIQKHYNYWLMSLSSMEF